MASRFPSIEEFDDGQTEAVQPGATALDLGLDEDPQADFLSREKATLGADADLFATEDDNAILSGGEQFDSSFPSLTVGNEVGNASGSTREAMRGRGGRGGAVSPTKPDPHHHHLSVERRADEVLSGGCSWSALAAPLLEPQNPTFRVQ